MKKKLKTKIKKQLINKKNRNTINKTNRLIGIEEFIFWGFASFRMDFILSCGSNIKRSSTIIGNNRTQSRNSMEIKTRKIFKKVKWKLNTVLRLKMRSRLWAVEIKAVAAHETRRAYHAHWIVCLSNVVALCFS